MNLLSMSIAGTPVTPSLERRSRRRETSMEYASVAHSDGRVADAHLVREFAQAFVGR